MTWFSSSKLPNAGIAEKFRKAWQRRNDRDPGRRRLCMNCDFSVMCLVDKRAVLEHVIANHDVDTKCWMGRRARKFIEPGMTWRELGQRIGEEIHER